MFKCVFYVFVQDKCLLTAVIICIIVLVFCLSSNSVIIIMINNFETEHSDLLLSGKQNRLVGLHNKSENRAGNSISGHTLC